MVACGRMIKQLHPDALTVFAGPCLAKKSEAKEPDIAGAVDYVLTFQEIQDIFEAADIHPEELADKEKEHSSRAGRIYARTGGVSEAVQETEKQLRPDRKIKVKAEQADGIPACRELIKRIQNKETDANFFEGMGWMRGRAQSHLEPKRRAQAGKCIWRKRSLCAPAGKPLCNENA